MAIGTNNLTLSGLQQNILNTKNLAPPTFLQFFSQIEISFEILKLILTYIYKSLYLKVCPSNFSFVVLSLQLKLEKPVFCTRAVHFNRELKYFCIFLTVRA